LALLCEAVDHDGIAPMVVVKSKRLSCWIYDPNRISAKNLPELRSMHPVALEYDLGC